MNKKTTAIPRVKAPADKTAGKSSAERAVLHEKANNKAKAQAITQAQKNGKAERTKKWEDAKGKKGPAQGPAKTKLSQDEKNQVKGALRDAAHRMQNTANIPHSKDKFTVGGRAYSLPQPF